MNDWERIKEIFALVSEAKKEDREALIRSQCGGNAELEHEILSLLNAAEKTENLFEGVLNPSEFFPPASSQREVSNVFGPYRIVREIGRGGMGTVFLAERTDGEFNQRVALKIIRQSVTDKIAVERFRRERELLAGLSHPNIARLLDGGVSESGEPYFAMEFVDGKPLLNFAESLWPSIKDRLVLFLKICSAVAYSHKNLIIHRDLKPQNILVTSDGEPKLLDFGLAKVLVDSDKEQTATQFRAFTPAYASPEQILGRRVSTASDIYSLGLILFELLTGKRPFNHEGKSLDELVENITYATPPKPSGLSPAKSSLPGNAEKIEHDLDTIVLKCLAPEPDKRYATVEELGADIQRFLDGRPILARPQTFGYRAVKFARRNRTAAAAGVLITLALVVGFGVSLWQTNIARRERDRAERRFQDVRKLAYSLLFEITPKIENLEGSIPAREALIARSIEYLDSLAAEAGNDPELLSELAAAYEKIGELQGHHTKPNIGDLAGALESYKKANAIRRILPQTPENRRLTAENYRQLSDARWWQGDTEGSRLDLESAIGIYDAMLAEEPANPEIRIAHLRTLNDQAQWFQASNRYPEAISVCEKILAEVNSIDSSNIEVREILFMTLADLGNALSWNGQQQRAEKEMAIAIAGMQQIYNENPTNSRLRHLLWRALTLSSVIYEEIDDRRSLRFAQMALDVATKAIAAEPADIQARHNIARSTYRVGVVLVNLKRTKEAIEALSRSETMFKSLIGNEPRNNYYRSDLARINLRKGLALQQIGKREESNNSFTEAMKLWELMAESDPANKNVRRDIAMTNMYLGDNLEKMRKTEAAAEKYKAAVDMMTQLKNENALPEVDEPLIAKMERFIAKRR